jgi:flagellar biosynthesis/type III secretory pathway chaperone
MAHSESAELRRRVVEIIGKCVYHALGLKETLVDERKALEDQDTTALRTALESKGRCVAELRRMEEERNELCMAAGFAAGLDQMPQVVEHCDENAAIANSWQHLMDIATECDSLNVTNGAIIQGRKQQIETSIAIIRGGNPTMDTYDRSGREPHGHNLRSIAEA